VRPSNEGADIEAVIEASRDRLSKLDTTGARDARAGGGELAALSPDPTDGSDQ
jgi:hypothetical protein